MGELLSVKNINVYYGSIHAIKDVSFHVDEGEIVTLIGANGAGKTTTMHAISGLLKLASGEITYDGNLISKMEAHKIVRLGLAQVPEGRRVFSGLTVQQNLSMGAYTRHDPSLHFISICPHQFHLHNAPPRSCQYAGCSEKTCSSAAFTESYFFLPVSWFCLPAIFLYRIRLYQQTDLSYTRSRKLYLNTSIYLSFSL